MQSWLLGQPWSVSILLDFYLTTCSSSSSENCSKIPRDNRKSASECPFLSAALLVGNFLPSSLHNTPNFLQFKVHLQNAFCSVKLFPIHQFYFCFWVYIFGFCALWVPWKILWFLRTIYHFYYTLTVCLCLASSSSSCWRRIDTLSLKSFIWDCSVSISLLLDVSCK